MLDQLARAALVRRDYIRRTAPAVGILSGPASAEDGLYYERTKAGERSSDDLAAELRALGTSHVEVVDVTTTYDWTASVKKFDLVVINLHGAPGEDGSIQGVLRWQDVRFVGSDVEASVLALNKHITKLLAMATGVPTPRFELLSGAVEDHSIAEGVKLVGKPVRGGSSLHTRMLPSRGLPLGDDSWIVEDYLEGEDVTVAVVEVSGRAVALPGVVLRHEGSMYDVDQKIPIDLAYKASATRPPGLTADIARCEELAVQMHEAIGAAHISRSDFILHQGSQFFLEINTLPGLSRLSNVMECAKLAGLNYGDLVALIVGAGLESPVRRTSIRVN